MSQWTDDIKAALESLGGEAHLSQIYAAVEKIQTQRGSSLVYRDSSVRHYLETHSRDSTQFKGGGDYFYSVHGLRNGRWGLRSFAKPTPIAVDIAADDVSPAPRVETAVYRILRDTDLGRRLKWEYEYKCQVCQTALTIGPDLYAEAHHVRPLGRPHNGPDVRSNILVLCPNHHVLFDYGSIALDTQKLHFIPGHLIASEYIDYHNSRIVNQPSSRIG